MLQQLINHSPDIKKLSDEGYQLEINGGHLLAHHIPYVNSAKEVKFGKLVCVLTLIGPTTVGKPPDHTAFFCGETPCDKDGNALRAIINNSVKQNLGSGILVDHFFSSKPPGGKYLDYYEKIRTYSEILSAQARGLDASVTARPGYKKMGDQAQDVFKYPDTNAARAKIEHLNDRFRDQKILIVGMGGTGAYILDLISKTPVKEIHIYDGDIFQLHNAFRAPGAIDGEKLDQGNVLMKVDYYHDIYSRMHTGIKPHAEYVTNESMSRFAGFNFAFISVDKNEVRSMIAAGLLNLGIPFIDVGLGVNNIDDSLIGTLRTTAVTKLKSDHLNDRFGSTNSDENEYATNIQIADLNCLNAALAVMKWKKIIGFYQDLKQEHNILFFINTNKLLNEDFPA